MTEQQNGQLKTVQESAILNRRNALVAAGVISGVAGSNANAVIGTSDVTAKYESSGAEDTVDGVGIMVIGLVIAIAVISIVIAVVKKK